MGFAGVEQGSVAVVGESAEPECGAQTNRDRRPSRTPCDGDGRSGSSAPASSTRTAACRSANPAQSTSPSNRPGSRTASAACSTPTGSQLRQSRTEHSRSDQGDDSSDFGAKRESPSRRASWSAPSGSGDEADDHLFGVTVEFLGSDVVDGEAGCNRSSRYTRVRVGLVLDVGFDHCGIETNPSHWRRRVRWASPRSPPPPHQPRQRLGSELCLPVTDEGGTVGVPVFLEEAGQGLFFASGGLPMVFDLRM